MDCTREYNRLAYRRNPYHKKGKSHPSKDSLRSHARALVSSAIRWGKMAKKPCETCAEIVVQAHHDDYSKPLEVRWLCKVHHGMAHWKIRAKADELMKGNSHETDKE